MDASPNPAGSQTIVSSLRAWRWTQPRIVAAATAAAALILFGLVVWSWQQALSWWTLGWWLFALLALRASRPEFAAAAAVPALWLQPGAGLPMLGLAVLTSTALGPRPFWIEPGDDDEPVDVVVQRLATGMPSLVAVVTGGLVWGYVSPRGAVAATLAATLASASAQRGLEIVSGRRLPLRTGDLVRAGWWLAAWTWGALLVAAAGSDPAWVAVGLAAMLAVRREGAWKGSVAGGAIRRTADVPGWVEQVYALVLDSTHCAWFELRLAIDGSADRWAAGPDKQLEPGPAAPPRRPPVRFGIHRRAEWLTERHGLAVGDGELEVLVWLDPRQPAEAALEEQMDEVSRLAAAGRFDSAVENLPGGQLVDRQRVLELLNGAFASARESGQPLAIALVGLDHAREIQEVHGAEACERAMSAIGDAFGGLFGGNDAVCRYGGEEFLALFLGRTGADAVAMGEAVRVAVAKQEIDVDGETVPITASVGIAAHPEVYVARPSELIPLADSALYEARRRGGNGLLRASGRGRFADAGGQTVEGSPESQEVAAPRLFV